VDDISESAFERRGAGGIDAGDEQIMVLYYNVIAT
jgi:hypothetical protein